MTRLSALHHGLRSVRRRRAGVRLGAASSAFLTVCLAVLLALFALDVRLRMGRVERALALAGVAATAVWAGRRWLAPALAVREDDVTLAVMIERQQGIGSDLVAALQFSDEARPQFGSADLRQAVIEYTDELSRGIDYLEGFPLDLLRRRAVWLGATLVVWAGLAVISPRHVTAFFQRLLLSDAMYPTRTIIEDWLAPGEKAAYGQGVSFRVRASGELPPAGEVELRTRLSGLRSTLELKPVPGAPGEYEAVLPRVIEDLAYTLRLGDAVPAQRKLVVVPLPAVSIDWDIQTPAYARARFQASAQGAGPRVALEGSRVVPLVRCDKALRQATLSLEGRARELRQGPEGWSLDVAGTPLQAVAQTLRFELQVEDIDGLKLERPIAGVLQVRADQPPRVAAASSTRVVLPEASPSLRVGAVDDYALDAIAAEVRVIRAEATAGVEEPAPAVRAAPVVELRPLLSLRGEGVVREIQRDLKLPLKGLQLGLGDRVEVTVQATDFRGELPGKVGKAERLVFLVTDRAGVLAAMRELDAEMDKKLNEIIRAQLGLGEQP